MGAWLSLITDLFPPATQFTADDVPDMTGKVVLVTGANAGIGKETARVLLTKNAKVYVAARDQAKGEATVQELKERTGKEAIFMKLDLADLKAVKAAAEDFLRKEKQLNVLFNNAGVMNSPVEMLTEDGYDLQFGTNVLGHFYLTKLLMPLLLSTAKNATEGIARVVNTSSNGHALSGLHFNAMKDSPARRKMSTYALYGQSKTGNIVFSAELARRYGDQGIVSTSLNPGGIKTELGRHSGSLFIYLFGPFLHDVSFGALTQLYAGTTPDGAALNGKYLIPWARIGSPRPDTQDPQLGKELWTWCEEQVENV
ncbi:NAD(P)-binding protein [Leucogyrophana mollusca]|uniref:NAD(P)-binding protein n=1 Tax=Leucogyrophana mollusca TaxID=85980 RepID=A0ACB8BET2_9AGAM|nr:NAD(P)-binding protein [Leucogyrophana mollusca]